MIMARVKVPPPPTPWIARKTINWIMLFCEVSKTQDVRSEDAPEQERAR